MSGTTTTISSTPTTLTTTGAGNTVIIQTSLTNGLDNTNGTASLVGANNQISGNVTNTNGSLSLQAGTAISTNKDLLNEGGAITLNASTLLDYNGFDNSMGGQLTITGSSVTSPSVALIQSAFNNEDGQVSITNGALGLSGVFSGASGNVDFGGNGTLAVSSNPSLVNNLGTLENFTLSSDSVQFSLSGTNEISVQSMGNGVYEVLDNAIETAVFTLTSGESFIATSTLNSSSNFVLNGTTADPFAITHNNQTITTSQTVASILAENQGDTLSVAANTTLTVQAPGGITNTFNDQLNAASGAKIIDQGTFDNSNGGTISLNGNDPSNALNNSVNGVIAAGNGETISVVGAVDNALGGTIVLDGAGSFSADGISNTSGIIYAGSGETFTDSAGLVNTSQGLVSLYGAKATINGDINNSGGTINLFGGAILTAGVGFNGAGGTIGFSGSGNDLNAIAGQNLGTISGFTNGDEITLTGTSFSPANDQLTLTNTGVSVVNNGTTLATFSTVAGENFALTIGTQGEVEIICFLAGTRSATPDGEADVQTLRAGDMVLTASGASKPVRWVGQSTISTRFADPLRSSPIRIIAGALGENLPVRDLLVSPAHAMFMNGILVQAGALVNGTSIRRETISEERFTYYHIELESHELIVAEGAACESFIDTIDRMNFDNWDEHSEATLPEPMVEMEYPRAKSARQVPMALRQHIAQRADALLPTLAKTA